MQPHGSAAGRTELAGAAWPATARCPDCAAAGGLLQGACQRRRCSLLPQLSVALGRRSGRSRREGHNGLALETQPRNTLRALGVLSLAKQRLSHDMMAARREQGAKESCSG